MGGPALLQYLLPIELLGCSASSTCAAMLFFYTERQSVYV